MTLRHFRDDVLLKSAPGKAFVRFYYKHSPQIADFIREHEVLRTVVRLMLTPLIAVVRFPALIPLALFGLMAFAWRRTKSAYLRKVNPIGG